MESLPIDLRRQICLYLEIDDISNYFRAYDYSCNDYILWMNYVSYRYVPLSNIQYLIHGNSFFIIK